MCAYTIAQATYQQLSDSQTEIISKLFTVTDKGCGLRNTHYKVANMKTNDLAT